MKTDLTESKYIGIALDWNYRKEQVILSIKGYVQKALKEYQHKIQYERVDKSKQIKTIQEVFGKFLYIQAEQ